jgi:ketosteroid isomerase-like protein
MKIISLLALIMASPLIAQEPDTSSALFNMREAELNFARESVMLGRNASFVKNFADKSVVFTDKWITDGKQFSKDQKAALLVLKWEPEFMDISLSRDFGFSTGPWEAQEYRPNTAPVATGYYLTVWKKQPEGVWKVILDGSSTTPAVINPRHDFSFPPGADKPVARVPEVNTEISCREMLNTEKQFMLDSQTKSGISYTDFFAPDARLQLTNHLPTTDDDTINFLISLLPKNLYWESTGAGAATSGDMGYTYGLLKITGNNDVIKGHFVRIWKRKPGENWKIAMEMINADK